MRIILFTFILSLFTYSNYFTQSNNPTPEIDYYGKTIFAICEANQTSSLTLDITKYPKKSIDLLVQEMSSYFEKIENITVDNEYSILSITYNSLVNYEELIQFFEKYNINYLRSSNK